MMRFQASENRPFLDVSEHIIYAIINYSVTQGFCYKAFAMKKPISSVQI